jgi:hypothetical protein
MQSRIELTLTDEPPQALAIALISAVPGPASGLL